MSSCALFPGQKKKTFLQEHWNMLFLTLLLLFGIKEAVSRKTEERYEVIKVRLGKPLTFDCTYNCSTGFIRGYWNWEQCSSCVWETQSKNKIEKENCTVSLHTRNLTLEQTLYNYSCISEKSDDQDLARKIERLISLRIQDRTATPFTPQAERLDVSMKVMIYKNEENYSLDGLSVHSIKVPMGTQLKLKCLSNDNHCEGGWMRDNSTLPKDNSGTLVEWGKIREEDEGSYRCYAKPPCTSQGITVIIEAINDDEFRWIKPLAAVSLSSAFTLILLLAYLCYQKRCASSDTEDVCDAIYENTRAKSKGTVLKPLEQDGHSDHEVPYADIVISVRGSSIPELTGVHSQTPRDHRLRWREETGVGPRLHACRSADRLHVHPKEVTRKLSTTSEYAVITYSTEALH